MGAVAMKQHGARARARDWFKSNPGEYLTIQDMVDRFGFSTPRCASQSVHLLKMEGLLKSVHVVFSDPDRPRI